VSESRTIVELVTALVGPQADPVAAGRALQQLGQADPEQLPELVSALASRTQEIAESDPAVLNALALAVQRLAVGSDQSEALESEETGAGEQSVSAAGDRLDSEQIAAIVLAHPPNATGRHRWMYLLSVMRSAKSLAVLARLLQQRPPQQWDEVGQVLSPLMQHADWDPAQLFPAALDALAHRSVAAPLLDLANFLFRSGRSGEVHPAAQRREMLVTLLGAVADRLGKFEEDPRSFGDSVEEVQAVLHEAVALGVSLCDTLALVGAEEATPQLFKALELRHRRVQCEAAGALARLGVEEGKERLIALAEEPAARLRVIAYADELGIGDRIAAEYRTDVSRAEAELALWLSQPQHMGVPPSRVEVIDSRLQYWPSFERPIDCFLVRFEYDFGDRSYSNVGITGPTVHAAAADLANLPLEDIYAVYAGWHAEHPEIFQVPADQWNAAQRRLAEPLTEALDRLGFEQIEPVTLGFFLDEHALVARARRDETECLVVTDGLETADFATEGRQRPMGPDDLWHLYLGRKMLRTFNP
jgi:hypothetical protein